MLKLVIQLICILLLGVTQSYCTHISAKSMDNDQPDSLDIMEETSRKTDDVAVVLQHNTVQWNETTMNPEWTVSVDENSTNSVNETENHILTETVSEMTANVGTNKENQTDGVAPVSMAKVEPASGTQEPQSDQDASYWDVFKNKDEIGTIADLLDRMLNVLNVSSNSWNKYLYITALESPDGSLFVPYSHRQDTRIHLATLLGFAKFVVTNKDVRQRMGANGDGNDQTFIDSSKFTTALPTTEEHVTDKIRNGSEQICSEMLSTQDNVVSSTEVKKMADDCEVHNGIINTTFQSDEDSVVHNTTTWFDLFVDRQSTDSIDLKNSTSINEREDLSTNKPENQLPSEVSPDTKNNSSELNSVPEKTDSLVTKLVKLIESFLNVLSQVGKQGSHNYTMNSSVSDVSKEELKPVDEK